MMKKVHFDLSITAWKLFKQKDYSGKTIKIDKDKLPVCMKTLAGTASIQSCPV